MEAWQLLLSPAGDLTSELQVAVRAPVATVNRRRGRVGFLLFGIQRDRYPETSHIPTQLKLPPGAG